MAETYIKIGEAARMLGVSPSTLGSWQDKGILVPAQIFPSRHRRYTVSQVQEFIRTQENTSMMNGEDDNEDYLTSRETAEYMNVSLSLVNSLEAQGQLIPRRKLPTNNKRLYAKSDIDAFLERISSK